MLRATLVCLVLGLMLPGVAMAEPMELAGPGQVQRPMWGAYIWGAPQDPMLLNQFESLVGQRPDIIPWYQPWGDAVDRDALDQAAARGALPMITWEAWSAANLASIPSGQFDEYIDQWAHELAAFGKAVFLRPFHEMNNPLYPWAIGQSGNSSADLVRAWRYVHDRFAALGATNVMWVWCPNTENDAVSFADFYPGDQYVDWLGVDGYNGGSQLNWGGWRTPEELFKRSYDALTALNAAKPIMIAETSSVSRGGDRSQWIEDLYRRVPSVFPSIRAIVWFQTDTSNRGEADWRLQAEAGSVAAFRSAIGS
jgi:beta-mannanase